jgi:hypothetical protein
MNKHFLATILLASLCFPYAAPVIIIVHGTGSANKTWWNPGGAFFKEVEKTAELLGQHVVPFCWSGLPTYDQISVAGKNLAQLILSYPATDRVVVIGHSHGGNVLNKATQELFDPLAKICGGLSSRPIREIIEQMYQSIKTRPAQTVAELVVPVPMQMHGGFDYTYTLRAIPDIKMAIDAYKISPVYEKKNIIDCAIYLGTPVDEHQYKPCMDVVGNLINFYSSADRYQTVIGLYDRCYKKHPQVANLEVFVKEKHINAPVSPNHFELHMPLIGKWLLLVPEVLKCSQHAAHNFKKFAYGRNGVVVFDEAKGPIYLQENERDAYLAKFKRVPVLPNQHATMAADAAAILPAVIAQENAEDLSEEAEVEAGVVAEYVQAQAQIVAEVVS